MDWALIVPIVYGIILLIRDIPKRRKYYKVTVPQQLIRLVQQAHTGEVFSTEWNISVDADMREKLCYPLTPEQVELIKSTSYFQCQCKKFDYRLTGYKYTGSELSGIVLASIRFQDDSKNINLDFKDVPIYIRCGGKGKPGNGFRVCAVEHLQKGQDV